ncbi:hypothetical protein AMK59_1673, partial [Oryctes borbonicus]
PIPINFNYTYFSSNRHHFVLRNNAKNFDGNVYYNVYATATSSTSRPHSLSYENLITQQSTKIFPQALNEVNCSVTPSQRYALFGVDFPIISKQNYYVYIILSRLKTGWSVKTGSMGYQSTLPPLGADEQAVILDVIRRAEQLDHLEQERVGKLVERLENMRRNALGRNANQCLLCGDGFGMLGAQKCICIDCKRLVCQKCAIDNSPTKTRRYHAYYLAGQNNSKAIPFIFQQLQRQLVMHDLRRNARNLEEIRRLVLQEFT